MTSEIQKTDATPPPSLKSQVLRAARFVDRIADVYQVSGAFACDRSRAPSANVQVVLRDEPAAPYLKGDTLRVSIGYALEIRPKADVEAPPYMTVSAKFLVTYTMDLPEDEELDGDVLATFAEINARFNTTSYWREFVQSSLSRAGLPPLMIQPFDAAQRINALTDT